MKTLLFDTRLPADVLRRAFPQASAAAQMGSGDAGTQVFSVEFDSDDDRETFRAALRALEVELGLRPNVPARQRGRMYDLVDSFAPATAPSWANAPRKEQFRRTRSAHSHSRGPGSYSYSQKPNRPQP